MALEKTNEGFIGAFFFSFKGLFQVLSWSFDRAELIHYFEILCSVEHFITVVFGIDDETIAVFDSNVIFMWKNNV